MGGIARAIGKCCTGSDTPRSRPVQRVQLQRLCRTRVAPLGPFRLLDWHALCYYSSQRTTRAFPQARFAYPYSRPLTYQQGQRLPPVAGLFSCASHPFRPGAGLDERLAGFEQAFEARQEMRPSVGHGVVTPPKASTTAVCWSTGSKTYCVRLPTPSMVATNWPTPSYTSVVRRLSGSMVATC